jgi:sulfide dehydrogenase subunit beta
VKFACVDGPDFDGHLVDFDDLMSRLRRYVKDERAATERWSQNCRMKKVADPVDPLVDLLELTDPFEEVPGG